MSTIFTKRSTDKPAPLVWPPALVEEHYQTYLPGRADVQTILEHRSNITSIDAAGAVGSNQTSFAAVSVQREALWVLRHGINTENTTLIESGVKAFEWAFENHFDDVVGHFENGLGASDLDGATSDAFFLQAYGRAYYMLLRSPYYNDYASRLTTLNNDLPLAMTWLTSSAVVTKLGQVDNNAPNRLLFDANAYGLCGKIISSSTATNLASTFAQGAMDRQHADGYFLENGGWDSSYQGVSMFCMAILLSHFPEETISPTLLSSFTEACVWEDSRILATGEIDGTDNTRTGPDGGEGKDINYYEVILAFLLAASLLGDRNEYADQAESISGYGLTLI